MTTVFLPRSAWTDDPRPSGATKLVTSEVIGLAIHWPGGSGSVPTTKTATIQVLDGELAFHTNPVSKGGRGWSDIAYNFAADQEGRVWDLRGIENRSAANGDTEVNREYVAVTCLIGPKDTPSAALLQAVRDLRSEVVLKRYPKATRVVPHSLIRPDPTDCPGDDLREEIRAGTFTNSVTILEDDVALDSNDKTYISNAAYDGARKALRDLVTHDEQDDPDLKSVDVLRASVVSAQHSYDTMKGIQSVSSVLSALKLAERLDALLTAVAVLPGQIPPADVDEHALAAELLPLLQQGDLDVEAISQKLIEVLPGPVAAEVGRRLVTS